MQGVSLGDLLSAATVLVAVVTYVLTSRHDKALNRAELVHGYSGEFSRDADLMDLFTDIDYSRFTFVNDTTNWLGQAPEKRLIRLLDLFNSLGLNWHRKIVSLDDVHGTTLGYAILRAYSDPQVSTYLTFVDAFDAEHLGTGAAFEYFRLLAVALDKKSRAARAKTAQRLAAEGIRPSGPDPA